MSENRVDPDRALDLWLSEAQRGRDDDWLARHAGVSVRQVRAWRKRRKIDAPSTQPVVDTLNALRGLTGRFDPAFHRAADTVDFETPQYVIRESLDYTQFARAVFTLTAVCAFTPEQVAGALGVRLDDVSRALLIWRRHLSRHGRTCLGCDVLLDRRFGEFCSRSCRETAHR
jgi:hypothetical protein